MIEHCGIPKKGTPYLGSCSITHISTYRMKLAAKMMMKQKQADSGSSNPAVLRGQKNETEAD